MKNWKQGSESIWTELRKRGTDALGQYQPLQGQTPFHRSQAKERWIFGGNRSGKTTAAVWEGIAIALGRHPYWKIPVPNYGWVVSVDFPSSRDVIQPEYNRFLPQEMIESWNKADQIFKLKNGSIVGFKSADSGRRKFQGVKRHWIQFDEEPKGREGEAVYDECKFRLLDYDGITFGAMTPLMGMTWVYERIWKKAKTDKKIEVFQLNTEDNNHLKNKAVVIAELKKKYSGLILKARLGGEFVNLEGEVVFPRHKFIRFEGYPRIDTFYTAVDPAISLKKKADQSAIVTLGVDAKSRIYVLEVKRNKWGTFELIDEIAKTWRSFRPQFVGIETAVFQRVLKDVLLKFHPIIPVMEMKPDGDKMERARSVSYLVDNGLVYANNDDFLDEVSIFPHGRYDDVVDAFVYALKLVKNFSTPVSTYDYRYENMSERSRAMWNHWDRFAEDTQDVVAHHDPLAGLDVDLSTMYALEDME